MRTAPVSSGYSMRVQPVRLWRTVPQPLSRVIAMIGETKGAGRICAAYSALERQGRGTARAPGWAGMDSIVNPAWPAARLVPGAHASECAACGVPRHISTSPRLTAASTATGCSRR